MLQVRTRASRLVSGCTETTASQCAAATTATGRTASELGYSTSWKRARGWSGARCPRSKTWMWSTSTRGSCSPFLSYYLTLLIGASTLSTTQSKTSAAPGGQISAVKENKSFRGFPQILMTKLQKYAFSRISEAGCEVEERPGATSSPRSSFLSR